MIDTVEPPTPPNFRLILKLLAAGNWAALKRECLAGIGREPVPVNYARWRALHRLTKGRRARMRDQMRGWKIAPRISIILSRYDQKSIDSLTRQIYPDWQLIIVGESSEEFTDSRIRCAPTAGGLSTAIAGADGQYICFLTPGDELAEHALFRIAETLVGDPSLDIIYTDEDLISESNEHTTPFFKPDWSPEYFLAWMYTGRLAVYRREGVLKIGGVREEFDDAIEYDLVLRLMGASARIHHIPDVLYHRRANSVGAPTDAARRALQTHLDSTGQLAMVEINGATGLHRARFKLLAKPLVSIVIPTACRPMTVGNRSTWFLLECVSSIRRLSSYKNIEIVVSDNNDMPADLAVALAPFDVRCVPFAEKFNLTRKTNFVASHARGEQLILFNDDIEIITPDWIEAMLEFSQQPDIGAVGLMMLFPNDTQQHTGVVIQDGNPRHPFYHYPREHPGYFHSSEVHRNWAAVTGACTMTRTEVFKAVGGYSERFALSYNDVDYCLKILEIGKRVVYTPYGKVYHHESVSRPLTRPDHVTAFKQHWSARFPRDPYYNPNLGRHFRVRLS